MKNAHNIFHDIVLHAKLTVLFLLVACFAFAALGLFSFGIVSLPCVLLGRTGAFTVISDFTPDALLLITSGALTAGLGMCFGLIPICVSAYGVYSRSTKAAEIRRERTNDEDDEEDTTS